MRAQNNVITGRKSRGEGVIVSARPVNSFLAIVSPDRVDTVKIILADGYLFLIPRRSGTAEVTSPTERA